MKQTHKMLESDHEVQASMVGGMILAGLGLLFLAAWLVGLLIDAVAALLRWLLGI